MRIELTEANRETIYNGAWQMYKDAMLASYRDAFWRCDSAQRCLRAHWDTNTQWSDCADTDRYLYDNAIGDLQALDRNAHEAGMMALRVAES